MKIKTQTTRNPRHTSTTNVQAANIISNTNFPGTNVNAQSTPPTLLDPMSATIQNAHIRTFPTKLSARHHKNRRVRRRTVQQKIQPVYIRHKRKENTHNNDIMPEKPPKQDNYLPIRKRLRRECVDPKNYR